jgi:two-component system NtrC family sensor kinase
LPWKRTISFRLTMGFIAVVVVTHALLSLVTLLHLEKVHRSEVQTRVRLDLNSAWRVFHKSLDLMETTLAAVALDPRAADLEVEQRDAELRAHLDALDRTDRMDSLLLLDETGTVLHRTANPEASGDSLADNPLVAQARKEGQAVRGTILLPAGLLERCGPALATRARLPVLPTQAARPSERSEQADGLAQAVVVPVRDRSGRVRRYLCGVLLLNGRNEIVDAIKDDVFQNQKHQGKDIGTATLFQDDIRIATNVRDSLGQRALGTRMSQAVYERVISQGQIWADRAFVVNDWYITAYAPIRDPGDRVIGSLYVGLLEAPFDRAQRLTLGVFLGAMALTTLGTLGLLFLFTRRMLRPIGRVLRMTRQVVAGDLGARTGLRLSGEIGQLAAAVDLMAEAVSEREARLQRTAQQQLGQSEKLAAIGRLAAGVAHEINNPLTGVMTFAHLMRDKPNLDSQDREDLTLIIRETTRVREIVRALLDFARESPSRMRKLDLTEVLQHLMTLLRSQKAFSNIQVELRVEEPMPAVFGDANQLQQVLLNLALNACEAMPEGGRLRIDARSKETQVVVAISDTGYGIPPENLEIIFDPFFTTKPVGKGTGLGLSVSYGIVKQHRGELQVESQLGEGSTFRVILPGMPMDGGARIEEEA